MNDISWARRFFWSVRRELWEIPAISVAPLAAGAVVVLAHLVSMLRGAKAGVSPTVLASGAIMVTMIVVAVFYSVDSLYGERRDRSILFWKSLPVSDTTTVAAKAAVPFLIAPLIAFLVTEAVMLILMLLGVPHPPFMRASVLLFYHYFTVHVLWYAPFMGWLFLVSAWARRMPFVWAALPIFVITVVERITLGTVRIRTMLLTRLSVSPEAIVPKNMFPTDPHTQMTPLHFVSSGNLWIGLGITVLFLAIAIRLRRGQGPI